MTSICEYYMWQDFTVNNDNAVVGDFDCDILDIEVQFHHALAITFPARNQIPLITTHKSFFLPQNLIISSDDQSRSSIMDAILSTTGASRDFIDAILPDVSSFALEIVTHPSNNNVRVLTMALLLWVCTPYDEHEHIDQAIQETIQESASFKPASVSCIERLNRIRVRVSVDDDRLYEQCMVCLEKQTAGEEVIRLACGHVFHGDCIVKWLETSHSCPLCRFSVS